jgi:hypothetical protein
MSRIIAAAAFYALLVALATILSVLIRRHWPEIVAALRGELRP